jgi:hypothetical protein
MLRTVPQFLARRPTVRGAHLALASIGVVALLLGGCRYEFASMGCKKVHSDELHVAHGQSCKFRYDQGDVAKYVVVVTKPPYYGEASGDGKYLKYVAKPGFTGDDHLTIKVVRQGVGHVQWETRKVTVKVGPSA